MLQKRMVQKKKTTFGRGNCSRRLHKEKLYFLYKMFPDSRRKGFILGFLNPLAN